MDTHPRGRRRVGHIAPRSRWWVLGWDDRSDALRKAERYGEFDKTPRSPQPFQIGETVRIGEGFFSGYHALVQEFIAKMKSSTASKRAKVAIEYFGRMTTLELPVHALDRI